MKKSFSRISFFVLTALLLGGFPNFMSQEAHAAVPTFEAVTGDAFAGDSTATTNILVRFDTPVFTELVGGITTGWSVTNAGGASFSSITAIEVTTIAGTCTSGGTTDVTITLDQAIPTGSTPTVSYAAGTPIYSCNTDEQLADGNDVADDGLRPTLSSASVTSATTIVATFSENMDTGGTIIAADFTVTNPTTTINSVSVSGSTVTLNLASSLSDSATPTVTVVGTSSGVDDAASVKTNTLTSGNVVSTSGFTTATNNSGGGSGCDDCEAPTLGIDKNGRQIVSNGFTYNGNSVDAERFFTPYPLITANVGKTNTADFKLYENEGISNIRHFTLAFGMDKGDIISDSKAKIELDIDHEGTETVTVTDPENVLDNIKVTTSTVSCSDDSFTECLGISIQHRFRAPLDFNIVATDVWDTKRNSWQNYFNHGIEVVGESLNPAKEYDGINKGHIYHLTETSKTSAVDEFGNSWTLEYGLWNKDIQLFKTPVTLFLNEIILADNGIAGSDQFGTMYYLTETSITTAVDMFGNTWTFDGELWTMDSIYSKMILDGTPMGGYTRDDSKFDTFKYGQFLLAENKLHEMCPECSDEPFGEINNIFAYDFPLTN